MPKKTRTAPRSDPRAQKILRIAMVMNAAATIEGAEETEVFSAIALILAQTFMGHPDEEVRSFCDSMYEAILINNRTTREVSN